MKTSQARKSPKNNLRTIQPNNSLLINHRTNRMSGRRRSIPLILTLNPNIQTLTMQDNEAVITFTTSKRTSQLANFTSVVPSPDNHHHSC
ncbi:hypothetical protein INR49_029811 [Caranx melampygus]|nr:hypothetical protein INR49_029811 [Caranx melampygus]